MTLEDLGNVGEFVSAIGVVAFLIYLALQIRQNTKQISGNTNSFLGSVEIQTTQHHADWLVSVAQHSELARVWRIGLAAPAELSAEEEVQFAMLTGSAFYGIEGSFRPFKRGLLSEDSWEAMEKLVTHYMRSPGASQWWARRDVPFAKSFSEFVDSRLPATADNEARSSAESIWSGLAA